MDEKVANKSILLPCQVPIFSENRFGAVKISHIHIFCSNEQTGTSAGQMAK